MKKKMDSFRKPNALSFHGNTSENWRRLKQLYDIYLTVSGREKKDNSVKIAISVNNYTRLPFGIASAPEVFQNVCLICFKTFKVLKLLWIIMLCGETLPRGCRAA